MERSKVAIIGALGMLWSAGTALADIAPVTYYFDCITNNNAVDALIGETQMSVQVSEVVGSEATFTFFNTGQSPSSICQIYFEDGPLLGAAQITEFFIGGQQVTSFNESSNPPGSDNLPGANNASPPFVATEAFDALADSPVEPNGVNPGEQVTIKFDLIPPDGSALAALADGSLRIGIHVQGFSSGGSESFVSSPDPTVPVPASAVLVPVGLGTIGVLKRRARRWA